MRQQPTVGTTEVGYQVDLRVGGKTDPMHGDPVSLTGYVKTISDGRFLEPTNRKLIALKSAVHFRADYTPIAHEILEVDTPGVHSPNLFSYDYRKLRRPIYPLDTENVRR